MNKKQLALLLLASLGVTLKCLGQLFECYGIVSFYEFFTTSQIPIILSFISSVLMVIFVVSIITYILYFAIPAFVKFMKSAYYD